MAHSDHRIFAFGLPSWISHETCAGPHTHEHHSCGCRILQHLQQASSLTVCVRQCLQLEAQSQAGWWEEFSQVNRLNRCLTLLVPTVSTVMTRPSQQYQHLSLSVARFPPCWIPGCLSMVNYPTKPRGCSSAGSSCGSG